MSAYLIYFFYSQVPQVFSALFYQYITKSEMWRAAAGNNVQVAAADDDDDWETDPDFEVCLYY